MQIPTVRKKADKKPTAEELALEQGLQLVQAHPLFGQLPNSIVLVKENPVKQGMATVDLHGEIHLNQNAGLLAAEWAYVIAHCALHNAFGHFDQEMMPWGDSSRMQKERSSAVACNTAVWNIACDIYITRFLADIKFGRPVIDPEIGMVPKGLQTERELYVYLMENHVAVETQQYGMAAAHRMDMVGLNTPIVYQTKGRYPTYNRFQEAFSRAIVYAIKRTIAKTAGRDEKGVFISAAASAAKWFIDHYPLLGAVAASFQIVEEPVYCARHQIQVAAIDVTEGKIYINPAMGFQEEEWKFVLAHEYLHAGLNHHARCGVREFTIWNIACDFVINGWLAEMQIGKIPPIDVLYDETLKHLSAETIYDMLMENLRSAKKLRTFRGYGLGDLLDGRTKKAVNGAEAMTLEDICREALLQGLEYQQDKLGRGFIPAGLVEEIRALAMPPIPWNVALANWFQEYIPFPEKQRSYARPSRRQGTTPDIPRPRYIYRQVLEDQRTFGVIVDTSGSMGMKDIGIALGAIASYAAAREVPYVRVVFCDAAAYDAGYLSPDEIAGKIMVKGRGGTALQPAVDLLEHAKDFPQDGPILIITDGAIESKLKLHRQHAFLLPKGRRLPFRTHAPVFYYE